MQATERRISPRYQGNELKLEISPLSWLGKKKTSSAALITNFARGGLAITTATKIKVGQPLLLSLLSEHHTLKQIPAEVVRFNGIQVDYLYSVKFRLDHLAPTARENACFVLAQIEHSVKNKSVNQSEHMIDSL